ncbi:MAG: UDP-N-acetylmuramoyl-L-alanyl-D-glutamate--2,6-diaminopimelate ligase [Pseudomonadaceae bacterium]|nr:UDP-N-acetylmuramoyl-L-alanyl-D-glutamate--2,6-diaminopimelate ligase [Pseudomonadaceae bacterium]
MNLRALLDDDTVPALELTGLAEHTQQVQPGFGYIAVASDEEVLLRHCRDAVARGAQALLIDSAAAKQTRLSQAEPDSCVCEVVDLAQRRGELAARFYRHPSAQMTCIGVTGTNGKTSVAYHIADLTSRLGTPMGYCGTLGWGSLDSLVDEGMTTGNSVALQRQLSDMRQAGLQGVCMEVSSHALDQNRASAVQFDIALFTNLSRDHLDYHGSMAAYAEAKAKLFTQWSLRAAIINVDDEFGQELTQLCSCPVVRVGQAGDWRWKHERHAQGLRVKWQTPLGDCEAVLPVLADFAVANVTLAMATLAALEYPLSKIIDAVTEMAGVPGRMEVVSGQPNQPTVVVDYAHTPDALEKVLHALRQTCEAQLYCVVGCGGDRDSGKRSMMGAVAADSSDRSWFTADNPRSEDPLQIIADMMAGVVSERSDRVVCEPDRRNAIYAAVAMAGAGDTVLIAGKGHEPEQDIAGVKYAFDDRLVASDALSKTAGRS